MSQIDSFEQNTFASFASFSFEFLSTNRSDLNSFFASHDFGQLPKRAVGHCYGHSDISPPPIHQLSCLRMNRMNTSLYRNDNKQWNQNSTSSAYCGAVLGFQWDHFWSEKIASCCPRLTFNFPSAYGKPKISKCLNLCFDCRFEICRKNC